MPLLGFNDKHQDEDDMSMSQKSPQEKLTSSSPEERREGVLLLSENLEYQETFLSMALEEEEPMVQSALFCAFAQQGGEIIPSLIRLLKSEQPATRNGAIQLMRQYPEETGLLIERLLKDEDVDTRIFTLNILQDLHHPQTAQWLHQVLMTEEDINVCATAIEACISQKVRDEEGWQQAQKRYQDDAFIAFSVNHARSVCPPFTSGEKHV